MRVTCAAVCIALCLAFVGGAQGLDVVRDGKAVARIVVPDSPDDYTKLAAGWIRDYVKKASGAELAIVEEGKDGGAGPRVCLGATKAAAAAGIRGEGIKWDGCRLAVKGETLFLVGHDEPGVGKVDYKAPKGTCRAAVTFLEDFCGVRWLVPSPMGESVPERKDIVVPDDLDRTVAPAFLYATGRFIYGARTPAGYANNFREALRLYTAGGHTWPVWVSVSQYYKDHPEYFALNGSQRCSTEWNHLCTSHPDVKLILLRELRKKFDEGYDWAQLAQSDGYRRCECPTCDAMDNYRTWQGGSETFVFKTLPENPCERILTVHRDIAAEALKSHPGKTVHIISYGPTTMPSRRFEKFPDNVVIELCNQDPRTIAAWQGKARAFTAYVYFWGTYNAPGPGPKYTAAQIADSLRFMRDNHIQGIYFCGAGECWGLEGHAYYACGKLLGNPDLDPQKLVEEYCNGLFGKAAPAMISFFSALDDRVQLYGRALKKVGALNNPESVYAALYPPPVLSRLEAILSSAEKLADDPRSKMWIGLSRISFDYVKHTANAYTLYRAFQANQNRTSLAQLQQAVEQWKAHRDKIVSLSKADIAQWFPGHHSWVDHFSANGRLNAIMRAPFDWDFEKMAAKYAAGGPQALAPIVAARVTQPPKLDGVIGEEAWKSAQPADIQLMTGGPAPVPTRVRLAFDDKNLYVAFECSEPQMAKMRLSEQRRDGPIWTLDCAEIFLDPEAAGSKYLHFIAAPVKGAYYDSRRGYIDDALNPLYGKADPSWNPDWQYAFVVDAGKKQWTIEAQLPFASLGVSAPTAGARWKANFGRERHAAAKGEKGEPELFLWSPNELGTGFAEQLCFGDVYFEKAPQQATGVGAVK